MAGNNHHTSHESRVTSYGDEINLLDYWKVIKKYRKMIVAIVGAASVIAVIASLLMTKIYRAEAVFIPVSSGAGGGLGALASQFGGLASMAGINLPSGAGDAEKLISILQSRTLIENVISKLNLMPILFEDKWNARSGGWRSYDPEGVPNLEEAVKKMADSVLVSDDKKMKTISIGANFKDPALAARIANAYLDELQNFINANAMTTAKRNRIFIEGQLEENKEDLLEAGKEINEFYKSGRVSSAEAKVHVPIGRDQSPVTSDQRSVPSDKQGKTLLAQNDVGVATNGVTTGSETSDESRVTSHDAESTPGLGSRVSSNEAEALLSQKAEVEKKLAEARTVRDVPQQVYLSYLMLRRELLGKVNALLTTQYEMAKIEESKEDLSFQVIDYAVPPVKRYKPQRAKICIMSFFAALFVAVFIAFFREYLERVKALEQQRRN